MRNQRRLAVALTVATMAVLGFCPAASATSTHPVTSDTSKSSCSSAWLRLWGLRGESCYGNGSLVVDLPGVAQEQIVGQHLVCLYRSSAGPLCATGPGAFRISPPIQVQKIVMSAGESSSPVAFRSASLAAEGRQRS